MSYPLLKGFSYSLPRSVQGDGDEMWSDDLKPKMSQMLRSKRGRYLGAAFFITCAFIVLSYRSRASLNLKSFNLPSYHVDSVDWSRYAYTQYVTNSAYLCNSVMLFEILHRLGSKADRLMMYPSDMHPNPATSTDESRLLLKAQNEYGVKLMPIEIQHKSGGDSTWADSYTKLLAFNQTQYDRVLSLDSDSTILQPMDELFLIPRSPVAMPRAYWLEQPYLSSQLVLIQPSVEEFKRIMDEIESTTGFDMEIVNDLYGHDCMILPHRPYNILTGEFRGRNHTRYMGNAYETWDPQKILKEAKFLHFSDWPMPKPWLAASDGVRDSTQPKCRDVDGEEDCLERDLWLGFYSDFKERRQRVCAVEESENTRRSLEIPKRNPLEFVLTDM